MTRVSRPHTARATGTPPPKCPPKPPNPQNQNQVSKFAQHPPQHTDRSHHWQGHSRHSARSSRRWPRRRQHNRRRQQNRPRKTSPKKKYNPGKWCRCRRPPLSMRHTVKCTPHGRLHSRHAGKRRGVVPSPPPRSPPPIPQEQVPRRRQRGSMTHTHEVGLTVSAPQTQEEEVGRGGLLG